MRFWDSSAILPLLDLESRSAEIGALVKDDPATAVWWATRLLRLHTLRAANSLQLAAALVLADFEPRTLEFVTLDRPLAAAARREGFEVVAVE